NYLAVGTNTELQIYSFDGASLSYIIGLEEAAASISWGPVVFDDMGVPNYKLVTSNPIWLSVTVYSFNTSVITPITTAVPTSANAAVSWHPIHQHIIGIGYSNGSNAQVGLLEFDGASLFPLGTPLTITPGTNTNAIDWSSSGEQLSAVTDEGALEVFNVATNSSTPLVSEAIEIHAEQNIASVSFAPSFDLNDNFLAIGGSTPPDNFELQLYEIIETEIAPNNHTITNNLVTKITTNDFDGNGNGDGVGIRANSLTNYVAANTSCNNDIAYELVSSDYITSQANARGVYNIDCADETLDQVKQTLDYVEPIALQTQQISIAVQSINNKIPLIPSQQPITNGSNLRPPLGTQTISQHGSYFLNEDVDSYIFINASDVTLDLNGFTVRGTIIIAQNNQKITIRNGKILPTDTYNIVLSTNHNT
ncbi:MAG: hypothetical protein U1E13_01075, partial [Methylophilaceae bacterium]|nr:hypothetical protein [Methylophilaceae bacterium]